MPVRPFDTNFLRNFTQDKLLGSPNGIWGKSLGVGGLNKINLMGPWG